MVVSKVEFQKLQEEINESYSKLYDRIEKLEQKVEELTPKKTTARKVASDGNE